MPRVPEARNSQDKEAECILRDGMWAGWDMGGMGCGRDGKYPRWEVDRMGCGRDGKWDAGCEGGPWQLMHRLAHELSRWVLEGLGNLMHRDHEHEIREQLEQCHALLLLHILLIRPARDVRNAPRKFREQTATRGHG